MPLMSMREYARHAGVSLKAIQDRIRNRSITQAAIVSDGGRFSKIDSDIADADFTGRHSPDAKMHGDLGNVRAKPTTQIKDDNPEGLPDGPQELAEKLPENCHEIATELSQTSQAADKIEENPPAKVSQKRPESVSKVSKTGVLPNSRPPEIPKAKVEEREIDGEKVPVTVVPPASSDTFERFRDAKTKTEDFRARKLELEVAEAEGRLLDADEVRKEIVKLVGETREAFLNLGPKLAPILVSITDPVEMENKLIEAINDTLHNLSRFDNGLG